MFSDDAALVGKNFSKAINSCKIFITTGNVQYKNLSPKYLEILASRTCLFAYEPLDAEKIGLIDGYNYVKVNEKNLQEKVRYYLAHEEEREKIADNGYWLAYKRYNCYSQAVFAMKQIYKKESKKDFVNAENMTKTYRKSKKGKSKDKIVLSLSRLIKRR